MSIAHKLKQHLAVTSDIIASSFLTSIIFYNTHPKRIKYFSKVFRIKRELHSPAKSLELYQLYTGVLATRKVKGDIAEVGVYRGTTAKAICEAKGSRPLHLFDTFTGLPKTQKIDVHFYEGEYSATLEQVTSYLASYPNVHFYKGLFPATGTPVSRKKFSFVHLDVDIYKSTKDSLTFFYPRMSKGSIIISHDYDSPSVRKAFDDFFTGKQEPVIELPGIQVLVVKV